MSIIRPLLFCMRLCACSSVYTAEEMNDHVISSLLTVQLTTLERTMPRGRRRRKNMASCLDDQGQVKAHGSTWTEYDCRHCQCKVR